MKITVRVRPGSKHASIKRMESPLLGEMKGPEFIIAVTEPAKEGKANHAVEKAIAEFLKVPRSCVHIVAGQTSRTKVVEVGCE